ncbi:MAG TPA: tetratricopeptide repeat protein [Nitriliruptorales bacterium]|nr:tetratricopeptide repeat protein [Nitriliruptorales bacterium]
MDGPLAGAGRWSWAGLQAGVLLTAGLHAYAVYREDAADLLHRSADLYAAVGADVHRALALIFGAGAREHLTGDIETARRGLEEGITLARRAGATNIVASGLTVWGELERKNGNHERARDIQQESLRIARETGELRRVAMITDNLGLIGHHLGDDETAERMIRESLLLSSEIGFEANAAHALIALAEQFALGGDPARAARLIGAADAYLEQLGLVAQPADAPDFGRIRAYVSEALGEDVYGCAVVDGEQLGLERAIDLALSDPASASALAQPSRHRGTS